MKYVERIRNIVLDQLKNETVCIYLFGSWARGTQHHGSDVDIAIDFKGKNIFSMFLGDIEKNSEEKINRKNPIKGDSVDVVDMHNASEGILQEIKKEGIRLK